MHALPARALPVAFAASVLLAGCAGDDTRTDRRPVIDTLPSGVVRVRGPDGGAWTDAERWRLVEHARIGRADGDGLDVFGAVWSIGFDHTGRVYVLDRIAKDIRVFSPDGQPIRRLGREGRGPGEFVQPFGMTWDSLGRLWVMDPNLARYSVFDTAGTPAGEVTRRVFGFSWPWPGRFAADGRLYEASLTSADPDPILAFPMEADVAPDTFPNALAGLVDGDFFDLRDRNGIGSVVAIPFGAASDWAITPDAHVWIGFSGAYALARRSLDGDTTLLIERDVPPVPVSGEERERAIEEDLGRFRDNPRLDLSRIPTTKPFFKRLLPDDSGHLWVLREGEGDAWFFDVFAPDGTFLGDVSLPVVPELYPPPRLGRDRMLVVTRDSLDVPSVVVYRIERGN